MPSAPAARAARAVPRTMVSTVIGRSRFPRAAASRTGKQAVLFLGFTDGFGAGPRRFRTQIQQVGPLGLQAQGHFHGRAAPGRAAARRRNCRGSG